MALGLRKRRRSCFELKCMSSGRRFRDLLFHCVLGKLILAPPVTNRASSSTSSSAKKSISNTSFSFLVFLTSATPGSAATVTFCGWKCGSTFLDPLYSPMLRTSPILPASFVKVTENILSFLTTQRHDISSWSRAIHVF